MCDSGTPGSGGPHPDPDDESVLRLHEEELSVEKQRVVSGRVRVSTVTHEREALVDEPLVQERVEISREPVGRHVTSMPEIRTEGEVTIIPVVEEVVVVERRLMLKEEVRVRRIRDTTRFEQHVTLRSQEAVIEREPLENQTAE